MLLNKFLAVLICSSIFLIAACQKENQASKDKINESTSLNFTLNSDQMMQHLKFIEEIANNDVGNRAVGTKGGLATAEYIISQVNKTGYAITESSFENREKVTGKNIIVEIPGESKNSSIILGTHYDSVESGPGINDNASGVALFLDLINHLSTNKVKLKHTLYFAFWDSEEKGIAGSQHFVENLTTDQLKQIKAYINADMVGTRNPEILIADGDKSSIAEMEKLFKDNGMSENDYKPLLDGLYKTPSHIGDLALENTLKQFFKDKNIKIKEDISTLTASDTAPFLGKVPIATLMLFNEKMNGDELEFAPCYHKRCDTIEHIDPKSMILAGDAIIYLLNSLNK